MNLAVDLASGVPPFEQVREGIRAGTFVAGPGISRSLREAASSYAATVRTLGVPEADAVEAVRRALGS